MKKVILLTILIQFSGILLAGLTEWKISDGGNGHWYEVVLVPERISWTDAKTEAELKGGYLATITSAEENSFVFSLVTTPACWTTGTPGTSLGPWLGGFQPDGSPEPDGNWQWLSGEPFTYTCWAPFEPSNGWGSEHFLSFYNGTENSMASTWNDLQNYDAPYAPVAYVVEYIPEPCTLLLLGLGGLLMRKR